MSMAILPRMAFFPLVARISPYIRWLLRGVAVLAISNGRPEKAPHKGLGAQHGAPATALNVALPENSSKTFIFSPPLIKS